MRASESHGQHSSARPPGLPRCTVIIPTLAVAERAGLLIRAIESTTRNQDRSHVLVVVNGAKYSRELLAQLRRRDDIQLLQIETPSLPAAIQAGRKAVRTPFFAFLDDDDEYLPEAVDIRVQLMSMHPHASIGVTNGFRRSAAGEVLAFRRLGAVEEDPLLALFVENWLASCGGMFRTEDLDPSLFDGIPQYLEWTWLAFTLISAGKRVVALDTPTFRINETGGSLSRSREYERRIVAVLAEMLERVSRSDVRRLLEKKLAEGWHTRSDSALKAGERREALMCHLRSLRYPPGWRFLPYSRRLLPLWPRTIQ